MTNGKPKKSIPKWLADWLADRPPMASADSEFGIITTSPDPKEVIRRIDEWLHAHPEFAKIPKIAKAYREKRQAAMKEIEAKKS
jgi:hypothetical protein